MTNTSVFTSAYLHWLYSLIRPVVQHCLESRTHIPQAWRGCVTAPPPSVSENNFHNLSAGFAQILTLKCHAHILKTSNREPFQSDFIFRGFYNQSASSTCEEVGGTREIKLWRKRVQFSLPQKTAPKDPSVAAAINGIFHNKITKNGSFSSWQTTCFCFTPDQRWSCAPSLTPHTKRKP